MLAARFAHAEPRVAQAGPDPAGAALALVSTPFRVAGDGVALFDANRFTKPVLQGIPSSCVRRVALALSQGSTGLMEGLRAEDVERLPQPAAAYLDNAPGAGRFDTLLIGLGSIRLAVEDALGGPALVLLRISGANQTAESVSDWLADERTRVLGPLAREEIPESESVTLRP